MSSSNNYISFIIPAKNEEKMLPITLDKIISVVGNELEYEIIVVDNGSCDGTVKIAESKGARTIIQNRGTIGSLRNAGVKISKGEILVFLDADVSLTKLWLPPFIKSLKLLSDQRRTIIGSRCSPPDSSGWIAKSWFNSSAITPNVTHVGAAHMITSKALFEKLHGFNETLESGEDYDFCRRARQIGAHIILDQTLKVIHHGVPSSFTEFVRREIWHGTGDVATLETFYRSKVALLAVVFLFGHTIALSALVDFEKSKLLFVAGIIVVSTVCVISAWKKYNHADIKVIFINSILFYVYYWARSVSIINRLLPFIKINSPRAGRSQF